MGSGRRGRSGGTSNGIMDAEALFSEALAKHRAYANAAALKLYDQVLALNPDHASALNFSGVLAFRAGDKAGGLARLRRSIDVAPDNARLLSNAGEIFRAAGEHQEAERALRRSLDLAPGNPAALTNLGCLLRDKGDLPGAAAAFNAALALAPGHADATYNLGVVLALQGRYEDALGLYRTSLASRPADADAFAKMGEALVYLDRDGEALDAFERALALGDELVLVDPFVLVQNLTAVYKRLRRYDDVTDAMRRALRRFPGRLDIKGELAVWLEENNAFDDAASLARKILEKAPADPRATVVMARLDGRAENWDQARRRLEALPRETWSSRVYFELANIHDREGNAERAFAKFVEGNRLVSEQGRWRLMNKTLYPAMINRIATWSMPENLRALAAAVPDDGLPTPAFLVGFNRSGTTLMEQVAAAADKVVITDENPFLARPLRVFRGLTGHGAPVGVENLTVAQVGELRASYWRAVGDGLGTPLKPGQMLLDKLPLNICHLVLIRRMFPDAPVLVALRDPRDVVLSNFMQIFTPNSATAHFFTVESTAKSYAATMDLWLRYRADLPGPWHEVRYEDLIADFDATVRGILDFLGLPWNESYRRFHKKAAKRIITTPSARDVAKPVFSRAAGRWKRYAEYLAPVQEILAPTVRAFGYEEEAGG